MPTLSSDEDSDNDNDDSSPSTPSEGVGDTGGGPPQPGTHSRDSTGSSAGRMVDVVAKDPGVSLFALPDNQEIFLTTTDFYVALRMHHMLAGRLSAARRLCREAGRSRQPVVACSQEVIIVKVMIMICVRTTRKVFVPNPSGCRSENQLCIVCTT